MLSPCGSAGRRQVSLMKRVDTSDATTSRGAEGVGPGLPAGATWSVVALVSEVGGGAGMATSWQVQREGHGREEGGGNTTAGQVGRVRKQEKQKKKKEQKRNHRNK